MVTRASVSLASQTHFYSVERVSLLQLSREQSATILLKIIDYEKEEITNNLKKFFQNFENATSRVSAEVLRWWKQRESVCRGG